MYFKEKDTIGEGGVFFAKFVSTLALEVDKENQQGTQQANQAESQENVGKCRCKETGKCKSESSAEDNVSSPCFPSKTEEQLCSFQQNLDFPFRDLPL